ncbi:alpha/beta hydrolase [Robiginitalea sp.]|jgi:predicted esterase|uniref:alpha/beta hydrolase n=1 Tax=Robiginitalea sp. TaxID=1902411 RepID=UPI003C78A369
MRLYSFFIAFPLLFSLQGMAQTDTFEAENIEKRTLAFAQRDSTLYLDFYQKKGDTAVRPCVIFIFGGGFAVGNRDGRAYHSYFKNLVNRGLKVASIDYRLGLAGIYDEVGVFNTKPLGTAIDMAVSDLYEATAFLLSKLDTLGVAPNHIIVSGSSAGAITSLQADWYLKNTHELSRILPADFTYAGVISFAGAIFSTKGKPRYQSPPSPTLLFHGTDDKTVPYTQRRLLNKGFFGSAVLAKHYLKEGYPFFLVTEQEASHSIAVSAMDERLDEILQFIGSAVLNKPHFQKEITLFPIQGK